MKEGAGERLVNLFIDAYRCIKEIPDPNLSPEEAMATGARYMAAIISRGLYHERIISLFQGGVLAEGVELDASDVIGCSQTGKKGWKRDEE